MSAKKYDDATKMMHSQSFSRIPDFPRSDSNTNVISTKNTFTRHA